MKDEVITIAFYSKEELGQLKEHSNSLEKINSLNNKHLKEMEAAYKALPTKHYAATDLNSKKVPATKDHPAVFVQTYDENGRVNGVIGFANVVKEEFFDLTKLMANGVDVKTAQDDFSKAIMNLHRIVAEKAGSALDKSMTKMGGEHGTAEAAATAMQNFEGNTEAKKDFLKEVLRNFYESDEWTNYKGCFTKDAWGKKDELGQVEELVEYMSDDCIGELFKGSADKFFGVVTKGWPTKPAEGKQWSYNDIKNTRIGKGGATEFPNRGVMAGAESGFPPAACIQELFDLDKSDEEISDFFKVLQCEELLAEAKKFASDNNLEQVPFRIPGIEVIEGSVMNHFMRVLSKTSQTKPMQKITMHDVLVHSTNPDLENAYFIKQEYLIDLDSSLDADGKAAAKKGLSIDKKMLEIDKDILNKPDDKSLLLKKKIAGIEYVLTCGNEQQKENLYDNLDHNMAKNNGKVKSTVDFYCPKNGNKRTPHKTQNESVAADFAKAVKPEYTPGSTASTGEQQTNR